MESNNKRLAINTIALYLKLSISIIIGIYSSRIVLDALGVANYGLVNVVGGIVAIMNTVAIAMHSVVYRYISIEIGKGDKGNVSYVFSISLNIFVFFALLLIILGCPIGRFYINNYLNVEGANIHDAHFVFVTSIVSSSISLVTIPYSSVIVACEKFIFTSVVEIAKSIIQFGLIIWMSFSSYNHLKLYACIVLILSVAASISHIIYNTKYNYNYISYRWVSSLKEYRDIGLYSFWIILGAIAIIFTNQGAGVLINSLWGLAVNASYGLANQIYTSLMQFVRNLTQAASPQIIKSYENNQDRSLYLVYTISRYSFFMLFVIVFPVVLNMHGLLEIWLVDVPEYLYEFVVIMIVNGLLWCVANGFDTSIQASGNIRFNQVAFSVITLSSLPLIVVFAKYGFPPYVISMINVVLYVIVIIMQCYVMKRISLFTLSDYYKHTIYPCIKILLFCTPYIYVHLILKQYYDNILFLLILSFIISVTVALLFGLGKSEKETLFKYIKSKKLYGKDSNIV